MRRERVHCVNPNSVFAIKAIDYLSMNRIECYVYVDTANKQLTDWLVSRSEVNGINNRGLVIVVKNWNDIVFYINLNKKEKVRDIVIDMTYQYESVFTKHDYPYEFRNSGFMLSHKDINEIKPHTLIYFTNDNLHSKCGFVSKARDWNYSYKRQTKSKKEGEAYYIYNLVLPNYLVGFEKRELRKLIIEGNIASTYIRMDLIRQGYHNKMMPHLVVGVKSNVGYDLPVFAFLENLIRNQPKGLHPNKFEIGCGSVRSQVKLNDFLKYANSLMYNSYSKDIKQRWYGQEVASELFTNMNNNGFILFNGYNAQVLLTEEAVFNMFKVNCIMSKDDLTLS